MVDTRSRSVASPAYGLAADERRAAALALVARDHGRLAERVKALPGAIEAGAGQAIIRERIEDLIAAAREHFVDEEWAMRTIGAPDYQAHKAEHGRLLRDAADMLKNFDTAFGPADWPAVAAYFRHWVASHDARFDGLLSARLRRSDDADPPAA